MTDPINDAVVWLADRIDLPVGDMRAILEEAEAAGVLAIRVVDEPAEPDQRLDAIREAGRGDCLCALSMIERVLTGAGKCGRGGCPYGGDR